MDTKNQAKPLEWCPRIRFSAFHHLKWLCGGVLGPFWKVFRTQVGPKLGQVGSMLEHKPNMKGQQKNIKKRAPKKLCRITQDHAKNRPVVPLKNIPEWLTADLTALETLHWCPEGTVADIANILLIYCLYILLI